jgi:hypothetical protein
MLSFTRELSTSLLYPSTPNSTSSAADTQHTIRIGFFGLPVALVAQALLLPHVQDQAGGITFITMNRGEAPVEVGREIKMLGIPMLERQDRRLRDGPASNRK